MERERSAAPCVAMLLVGLGRIQLAAARASKSAFSHYNPSCLGEIKYFNHCLHYMLSITFTVKGFSCIV